MYTKKVDKYDIIRIKKKTSRRNKKCQEKSAPKYTEEFKQTIVNLYQSGKTYSQIHKEYGVSHSALANWIKNTPR